MAGRGRGLTLPAWMTSKEHGPLSAPPSSNAAAAGASSAMATTIAMGLPASSDIGRAESRTGGPAPPQGPPPSTLHAPQWPPAQHPVPIPNPMKFPESLMVPPLNHLEQRTQPAVPSRAAPIPPPMVGNGLHGGFQPPPIRPPPQIHNEGVTFHPPFPGNLNGPFQIQAAQLPRPSQATGLFVQPPRAPPPPARPVIQDPNNDASCWSEHLNPDSRKYWFNKVTQLSTYDKPFCLKTPEERSIPPCPWKEYTNEGRKYYSNGTESRWTMPDEYKIWRDKVEVIEQKKRDADTAVKKDGINESARDSKAPINAPLSLSAQSVAPAAAVPTSSVPATSAGQNHPLTESASRQPSSGKTNAAAAVPKVATYSTHAEAVEAFKDLLAEQKISVTAKMKDAMDICQDDPRWLALKTAGERKQALAEYQTKRLKQDKEMLKVKARKHRDAFLLMLAENTDIGPRTRWRDAVEVLQTDARFKNIVDDREREDLFKDFVLELEKKEAEDIRKQRDAALLEFRSVLDDLSAKKIINRRSVWADSKTQLLEVLGKPELRGLDDIDCKRCFQDYIGAMEETYRRTERERRLKWQELLQSRQAKFSSFLEALVTEGKITASTRWKDLVALPDVVFADSFKELNDVIDSSDNISREADASKIGRDLFERVLENVQLSYRADKRLIKDVLQDAKVSIYHDSYYKDLLKLVLKVGRMREVESGGSQSGDASSTKNVLVVAADDSTEDGEEVEESPAAGESVQESRRNLSSGSKRTRREALRKMMMERPMVLRQVFDELQAADLVEYKEEQRRAKKLESRFLYLLEQSFATSDDVGMSWDDAKKVLHGRTAYEALGKSDRKRLFLSYMEDLGNKFAAKKKSLESLKTVAREETATAPVETLSIHPDTSSGVDDHTKRKRSLDTVSEAPKSRTGESSRQEGEHIVTPENDASPLSKKRLRGNADLHRAVQQQVKDGSIVHDEDRKSRRRKKEKKHKKKRENEDLSSDGEED